MNVPSVQLPATHFTYEPPRPAQQTPQETARPVAAPSPAEAATKEALRNEQRRGDRPDTGRDRQPTGEPGTAEQRETERLKHRDRDARTGAPAHQDPPGASDSTEVAVGAQPETVANSSPSAATQYTSGGIGQLLDTYA